MKDLGGSSFNLNDFIKESEKKELTTSEQISSMLKDIDHITIKEKKEERKKGRRNTFENVAKDVTSTASDSVVDTLDISFNVSDKYLDKNKDSRKNYNVVINDDDTYYPLKGETKPETSVTSVELLNQVIDLNDDCITEDRNFKVLNSDIVIDLDNPKAERVNKRAKNDKTNKINVDSNLKEFSDVSSRISSDDLFRDLGIETVSTIIRDNHQRTIKINVDEVKKEEVKEEKISDSPVQRKQHRLKEQESDHMLDEDAEFIQHSRIRYIDNKKRLADLFNEISKEDKAEDITSKYVERASQLIKNLDSIEENITSESKVNTDSVVTVLIQKLENSINDTGKRYITVLPEFITPEVRDVLKDEKYNLELLFAEDKYILAYKEIPDKYMNRHKKYIQKVLQELKDTLVKVNNGCKMTGSKRLQVPIIYSYMESGVQIFTNSELEMVQSTLQAGYVFELQNNRILIWGVK